MKANRKIITKILVGLAVFAGFSAGFNARVFADQQSIVSKAAFESVRQCYRAGAIRAWFLATKPDQFLLNNGADDTAKFPYGWTSATNNNLNCKSLMLGGDGFGGLIPSSAINAQNKDAVKDYFTKIGYTSEDKKGGVAGNAKKVTYTIGDFQCASGEDNASFGGKKTITFPTIGKTSDGKIKIIDPGDFAGGGNSYTATSNCNGLTLQVYMDNSSDEYNRTYRVSLNGVAYEQVSYNFNGNDIVVTGGNFTIANDPLSTGDPSYINLMYEEENVSVPSSEVTDYKLTAPNYNGMLPGLKSNNAAGYTLSGAKVGLTKQELFDLYTYYITTVYGARFAREGDSDFQGVDINLCNSVKYKVDKTNAATPNNVYGVDGDLLFNSVVDLDGVISMLDSQGTYDDIDNYGMCNASSEEGNNSANPNNPGAAGGTYDLDKAGLVDCNDLTDIGAMQWILCPTMNNMEYTTTWIDNWTQDWLQVKTSLYKGSDVDTIWGIIRNIANVIMVVILLVIIFSQLTGYGIDNYGIKKMLPRVIVMAIVINLSLYICQIAVDLSNIFGVGLRDLFGSIGESSDIETSFIGTMIQGLFVSAAAVGTGGSAAVGAGVTLATLGIGASLAIPVVIAVIVLLLVCLVAVMVLFLMLGAREIMVIFCVIISPLAFAAYILPNTQNLFKKWWEVFKAALIIYPICGAMSGISAMLRGLYNTNMELTPWGYAVLMILPYLGFFLMPMLLKNAISALGKVGGALTAMGQTFRSGGRAAGQGAMNVAKNTEAYKNLQNEALRRRQSDSADRTIARLQEIRDNGGQLTDAQTRRLARAQETKRKLANEDTAARTILTEREYAGISQDKLLADWNEAFDSGDADRMDALTNVLVARGGPGAVNKIASSLAGKEIFEQNPGGIDAAHPDGVRFVGGDDGDMARSFAALQANMQQNTALANAMQNKASDAYQMLMGGGYVEHDKVDAQGNVVKDAQGNVVRETTRANMAEHTANNNMATQVKDWATQSSSTLQRAAESGMLSQDMMKQILNSSDPTVQSGIQSDKDKRRVLEAGASGLLPTRTSTNRNVKWSSGDMEKAANRYRTQQEIDKVYDQAVRENAEFDRRAAERAATAARDKNIERIANALDNQNQNGGNNRS